MRFAALVLPDLALQLAARRAEVPLADAAAVLATREGGVERVLAASPKARALGLREGDTVAQARSLAPDLVVLRPEPGDEEATLNALAEALIALSPAVERRPPETLLLDGSALEVVRLPDEAAPGESREARWARALQGPAASLGLTCFVAVADTPAAARLFAHHAALRARADPWLVPPRTHSMLLGPLPLSLLERLAMEVHRHGPRSPDDERLELSNATFRWLGSLRLKTFAELRQLPARTLSTRLGAEAERLLFWAHGGRERPLDALQPSPLLEETVDFDTPVRGSEGLLFALTPLVERLALRVGARGQAVTALSADCALDLFEETAAGPVRRARERWEVRAARPTTQPRALRELVRGRLERWQAQAPVVRVTLSVTETAERHGQLSLGEKPRTLEALGSALGRLRERLGPRSVGLLSRSDHHLPERATAAAPFDAETLALPHNTPVDPRRETSGTGQHSDAGDDARWPLKLFAPELAEHASDPHGKPLRLRFRGVWHHLASLSPPVRLTTGWHEQPITRDYRSALLSSGTRLWLFLDAEGRFWVQGVHD